MTEFTGCLRFDRFELDLEGRELRGSGVPIPLQQQPLRILAYLALHAGEVVHRKALMDHLWNGCTYVDFEAGLNYGVRQIRKALGEDARRPRLLRTLNRYGYKLDSKTERVPVSRGSLSSPQGQRRITVTLGESEACMLGHLAFDIQQLLSSYCRSADAATVMLPHQAEVGLARAEDTSALATDPAQLGVGSEVWIGRSPKGSEYLAVLRVE